MPATDVQSNAVVTDREVIRGSIESLLSQIGATNTFEPIDQQFYDICCKRAIDKGYPMSTDPTVPSLRPCMNVGAQLAYYMYAHLENKETQMFIALYTAFMVYVDSAFVHDNQNLRVFIERFIRGKRQMDPVLQSLSHLLKEIPDHWEPVVASLILTGSLNFINAPTLEYQTQGMKTSPHADGYAGFTRQLSGAAEAFSLMLFPPSIPLENYIQCIPDAANFYNFSNDVYSFYKEVLEGDTGNYISVRAQCQGISAVSALQQLVDEVAKSDAQACKILEIDQVALDIWKKFTYGNAVFHLSCDRYRLPELMK